MMVTYIFNSLYKVVKIKIFRVIDSQKQMPCKDNLLSVGRLCICSFGVKIEISYECAEFNEGELSELLAKVLPNGFEKIESAAGEHRFRLFKNFRNEKWLYELHSETEFIAATQTKAEIFDRFESRIRITVAEFAVGKVFIHAGVIGWKGKALVLPGKSYHGKTTLVAELVRKGAEYFSDEYAVLDEDGYAHPFPKMLSVRGIIDDFQQVDLPVEKFGGKAAQKPLQVGLILLTEFEKNAVWKPEIMSPGEGILEILSHTIPIRYKPGFTLKVLNKVTNRAIITKTRRGEANLFADFILDFFEKQAIEAEIL